MRSRKGLYQWFSHDFISCHVKVHQGSCVVFSNRNNIWHRVGRISGYGSRKMVSFCLIDPKQRIQSSKDIMVNLYHNVIPILSYWMRQELNMQICRVLEQMIQKYVIENNSIRPQRVKQYQKMKEMRDEEKKYKPKYMWYQKGL